MRNELRIIGGLWRSRRIRFAPEPGLRPTPDRVRETVFNWLQNHVAGAVCLDLFAGSGALGFEAASRGAARVVQVERNPKVCAVLKQSCAMLDAGQITVVCAEAMKFLAGRPEAFDLVFLDPPFRTGQVGPCCRRLEDGGWLKPGARTYVEAEAGPQPEGIPANWMLLREKVSGDVAYRLYQRLKEPRV
ncbi:16S rRNA (guanine(966)-N(2))-methyltransferase RsmD [Methylococcus sp. Mc7]|uniref:16S rRNA (guanine(966)-N(2))-methyltransferase RsmD n=1 Tax=Methylococcus sp. Mc7 TaxID=2860258 RepID=UPI001C52C2ED|nr:16S rRNA (guanine(966)-N(2))-methyltransferase RsmD [Methylococcus sp. Mc7]QXP85291.1 16S rRNA (guanine(966)-N(2))-methyltransferase RsmD [Methylococcus sp. Mc7]